MPNDHTHIEAIQALTSLAVLCIAGLSIVIAYLGFIPLKKGKSWTIGAFAAWTIIVLSLAVFTFHPAIRAIIYLNSPVMFVVAGSISGIVLFTLRVLAKELYGAVELIVAITTLFILGREYDSHNDITIIVAFVGGTYVFVRGLTNIHEGFKGREIGRSPPLI